MTSLSISNYPMREANKKGEPFTLWLSDPCAALPERCSPSFPTGLSKSLSSIASKPLRDRPGADRDRWRRNSPHLGDARYLAKDRAIRGRRRGGNVPSRRVEVQGREDGEKSREDPPVGASVRHTAIADGAVPGAHRREHSAAGAPRPAARRPLRKRSVPWRGSR